MNALVAVVIGLVVGGVTAGLIALTMVTFSIASTPDWSLGVWFLWTCAWAVASYFYLRRHPIL